MFPSKSLCRCVGEQGKTQSKEDNSLEKYSQNSIHCIAYQLFTIYFLDKARLFLLNSQSEYVLVTQRSEQTNIPKEAIGQILLQERHQY